VGAGDRILPSASIEIGPAERRGKREADDVIQWPTFCREQKPREGVYSVPMAFRRSSPTLAILRRWPFVVVGILAFILGMFAGRLYNSPKAPLPETDDTELRIDAEINHVLAQETGSLTHENWSLAMENLVEVGKRAVPKLLATIEKARDLASSYVGSSDYFIKTQTRIIQTRAVMILGQIGDARALPALYKLRAEDELCPLRCEVDYAIKNIERRQGRFAMAP
jgi:hypothetical protein